MPQTKCSKEDNRTPLEKLKAIDTKIGLSMFFNYYDGISTKGMVGFDLKIGPPGSTKHRTGIFPVAYTKGQFRSRGMRYASLAQQFIKANEIPPPELRPHLSAGEIEEIQAVARDDRSPMDRLNQITDPLELFIFAKYFEGLITNGESGFDLCSGCSGSINHKRVYRTYLAAISETQFQKLGKEFVQLAKDFLELGIIPDIDVPEPEATIPWALIDKAHRHL